VGTPSRYRAVWRARAQLLRAVLNRVGPEPAAFAAFGTGSLLLPPVRVANPQYIAIGEHVQMLEGGWLSVEPAHADVVPSLSIGDRTRIGRGCVIACTGRVTIGQDVLTADNVFIGDSYHAYDDPTRPVAAQGMSRPRAVHIGDGAFLGAHAVVLPGVQVGANAYVGAGAVVTHDVPPRCVVAGNPARLLRRWDQPSGTWTPA
jgi:acetyltransferase-like isoleucine patch superfamily enzyme